MEHCNALVGLQLLERAVTEVLAGGQCLGCAEISRRAGIYRAHGHSRHDGITEGILHKLLDAGKVIRCNQANGRGGWRLAAGPSAPGSPDSCRSHEMT